MSAEWLRESRGCFCETLLCLSKMFGSTGRKAEELLKRVPFMTRASTPISPSRFGAFPSEWKERRQKWRRKCAETGPISPLLRFGAWNESSRRRVRDLISLNGGFCQVGEPKLMQLNARVSSFCQEVVFLGGEEEREWTSGSDAPLSTSESEFLLGCRLIDLLLSLPFPPVCFPFSLSCVAI